MEYSNIIFEQENGVVCITMNRPERMNSLDPGLLQELTHALRVAKEDDTAKALVLTGAGRCFCAGADIGAPVLGIDPKQDGITRETRIQPFVAFGALVKGMREFHKPAIAAINGHAFGGGLCLACLCDLRIASEEAKFSAVFVKRGLVADIGATYLLPRAVGVEKALELMWTGDVVDAAEARRIGLVCRVVPPAELMSTAVGLAEGIAKGPSVAIELMKRLVYEGMETNNFPMQIAAEAWAQETCYATADFWEGMQSFHEKREPEFSGQ